jgi:LacI family transcriptional regulator
MKTDTILFFQTSSKIPSREKIAGALRYLETSDWPAQLIEVNLTTKDIRKALHHWSPTGCIIDRGLSSARSPIRLMNEIPTIYIDQNPQTAAANNWYIRNDSHATVKMAFTELLRLKPLHYAFVKLNRQTFWNREREEVFKELVTREKLAFTVLENNLDLSTNLRSLPKPCGLLAVNDTVARDVIVAARKADIRLPEELQIIGINNDEFICLHTKPTLSSVHLDFEGSGYLAMATLHRIVQGTTAAPQTVLFGPKTLIRRASTRLLKNADPRVTRALDFIATNSSNPNISTSQIAAIMGCSTSLANILFRKGTGRTIRDTIQAERIKTAKWLLSDPKRELAAIPSLCGYQSLPTFARTFKAVTGMTMLSYRNQQQ